MDRERESILRAHREWLGLVQPEGLVVAPAVMADAQAAPDRAAGSRQDAFRALLDDSRADPLHVLRDWLDWEDGDLVDPAEHRDTLEIALPELGAVLAPTRAVPAPGEAGAWTMLVRVEDGAADLDSPPAGADGWGASRHARFERLLRETKIPIGLLCSEERLRLVYAPRGESAGHLTFVFSEMAAAAGRPILAACDMLLGAGRLFAGPEEARLPALLARSREAQAEVSTRLSRQVLAALHELLRGFAAADSREGRGRLAALARERPDELYGGLIAALMRCVFVLYAEDRGLMPRHEVYREHYGLGGLFARLRGDAALWPDTMDQRFGAWAQLLALFRLVHGGGAHGSLVFAARGGNLFDPDRFPFLEGRGAGADADDADGAAVPLVPDSAVWSVLRKLMLLDGERLSWRALDVEQIGSVYEAVMGFRVELARGASIAVRSPKRSGAAAVVDLDALLALDGGKRAAALRKAADRNLPPAAAAALRAARNPGEAAAALGNLVDRDATPRLVPPGAPVLQPTDARRRSGSHYTPRALTAPIVREALRPALARLGGAPRPEAVLDLKLLDPAMGSGAFLVESCRQLADRLTDAWAAHGGAPAEAGDDPLAHARRLVARRCLYGVDRNPMAVDLAKLSLWLATLAADHEFTFLDHALRHGDFLVGLSRSAIAAVHWSGGESHHMAFALVRDRARKAEAERARIRAAAGDIGEAASRRMLDRADGFLDDVRCVGDAVIAAFFAADKPRAREAERARVLEALELGGARWRDALDSRAAALRRGAESAVPFHFEIEFPEVFDRDNPGFDAVVGNPPFAGKNTVAAANAAGYPEWLKTVHPESHGNADLVAHFFRRAFALLRRDGAFGLIATNTIGQGDTRFTGLRWICKRGGAIQRATRRIKWPGEAAVVVSVVHVVKGEAARPVVLDGREVERVTAFLFHDGGHDDPERLEANAGKSFQGNIMLGMGFTFDDTDSKGIATPLAEMRRLIAEDPRNEEVIFPYIGGDEVNSSPTHAHHRYVINFRDWPLRREELGDNWRDADEKQRKQWLRAGIVPSDYPDPVAADWPNLLAIVERTVRPQRAALPPKNSINIAASKLWWRFLAYRQRLHASISGLNRVLAVSRYSENLPFTYLAPGSVYNDSLVLFSSQTTISFCILQCRLHEIWARFFSSSFGDGLRYAPSDVFETFPFLENLEDHSELDGIGERYYESRASLMSANDEGLTKIYNRFHDPEERDPGIAELRELHAAMDRAVLDAYGWRDVPTDCEFLLDHEAGDGESPRKKKPWRYRWPDAVRDEVLARLLALNADRAAAERRAGAARR